jgi:hypothetical protein
MSRILIITEENHRDFDANTIAGEVMQALRRMRCLPVELTLPDTTLRPWWFEAWPEIARSYCAGVVIVPANGLRMNALLSALLPRAQIPGPLWVVGNGMDAEGVRRMVPAHRQILFLAPTQVSLAEQALEFLNFVQQLRQRRSDRQQ